MRKITKKKMFDTLSSGKMVSLCWITYYPFESIELAMEDVKNDPDELMLMEHRNVTEVHSTYIKFCNGSYLYKHDFNECYEHTTEAGLTFMIGSYRFYDEYAEKEMVKSLVYLIF